MKREKCLTCKNRYEDCFILMVQKLKPLCEQKELKKMINIGKICPDCANARKQDTQSKLDSMLDAFKVGKEIFFKVAVTDGVSTEHIWVEVESINFENRTFSGPWGNDFVLMATTTKGVINCPFDEIESVIIDGQPQ